MGIQISYDYGKDELIWFDVGHAFGMRDKKDQRHGYPVTSRGPVLAYAIFAAIVIGSILLAL